MKTSSVRNLAYLIKKRLSGEERLAVDCEVALVAIPVRSTSGTSILNCRIASFVVSACVCVGIQKRSPSGIYLWNVCADHSTVMPAALITLAHFSVDSATNAENSARVLTNGM